MAKWLRSSFPASSLSILNNAMGGTTSGLAASCTNHFVPQARGRRQLEAATPGGAASSSWLAVHGPAGLCPVESKLKCCLAVTCPVLLHVRCCYSSLAPLQNASLVIIEFSINDIRGLKLHHPQRAAFEMLLRNLRARPRPPAVLLLHHWW